MLACLVGVLVTATSVSVDASADGPCQLAERLAGALAAQHFEVRAGAPWRVEVRGREPLVVRLFDASGALVGERALTVAAADCDVLPRTVALLVRAWTGSRLAAPPAPPPPSRATSRPVTRRAPTGARPAEVAPRSVEKPADAGLEAPPGEPAGGAPPPGAPDAPDAGPLALPPEAARPTAPPVSAWLGGAVALAPADQTVGGVLVSGDVLVLGRFGVALEGGLESTRSVSAASGRLNASLQWVGAGVLAMPLRRAGHHLVVGLGARAVRIAAWSEALATTRSVELWTAAFAGSAEWRERLVAGLTLALRATVQARIRPERFSISGSSATLELPPWGFALGLLLGWTWE